MISCTSLKKVFPNIIRCYLTCVEKLEKTPDATRLCYRLISIRISLIVVQSFNVHLPRTRRRSFKASGPELIKSYNWTIMACVICTAEKASWITKNLCQVIAALWCNNVLDWLFWLGRSWLRTIWFRLLAREQTWWNASEPNALYYGSSICVHYVYEKPQN